MYRRLHRQPWLLATSLPHEAGAEQRIKRMYEQRMQIEETFRDLKSHRSGLGLRYCRSSNIDRMQVLLLIGALAMLACGWSGSARRSSAGHVASRRTRSIVALCCRSSFSVGAYCCAMSSS
jgi:hypothetical protein